MSLTGGWEVGRPQREVDTQTLDAGVDVTETDRHTRTNPELNHAKSAAVVGAAIC